MKKGLRRKISSIVARVADEEKAVVTLEKLLKRFQDRALKKSQLRSLDTHRLKQSAIRDLQRIIMEKPSGREAGVVFVSSNGTSSTCPVCGSPLAPMTDGVQRCRWRPRLVKCVKYGFAHDRDDVGAWNVALKALKLDVSRIPLGSKGTYDLRVEWLVAIANHGAKAQPVLEKPTET